jgi:hypothetical protein
MQIAILLLIEARRFHSQTSLAIAQQGRQLTGYRHL